MDGGDVVDDVGIGEAVPLAELEAVADDFGPEVDVEVVGAGASPAGPRADGKPPELTFFTQGGYITFYENSGDFSAARLPDPSEPRWAHGV